MRAERREKKASLRVFITSSVGSLEGSGEDREGDGVEEASVDDGCDEEEEEEEERAEGGIRKTVSESEGAVTVSSRWVSPNLRWKESFKSIH